MMFLRMHGCAKRNPRGSTIPWWALILAGALALAFAFGVAAQDCGDNGGFAGRVFKPQYDRPHIPIVYVEVEDPHATCLLLGIATATEGRRILECADVDLRIDNYQGIVIVPKNPPEWLKKHGACHIRYGRWHG